MAIVSQESIIYVVVSGPLKGTKCVIRSVESKDRVGVIDIDGRDQNKIVFVERGELAPLELPGWEDDFSYAHPCTIQEKLAYDRMGDVIRESHIVQPEVLRAGDVLATGEVVVEAPRRGCNSSVLIRLDRTGWVELAPRLPLALDGNEKFKMPVELAVNDKLATGCLVVKNPDSIIIGWTNVYLRRENCCIDVPSCIPLALA